MKKLFAPLLIALVAIAAVKAGATSSETVSAFPPPTEAHGDPASQIEKELGAPGRRVAAYTAKEVAAPGKIVGTVKLAGPAPELPPLKRTKDPAICGATGADETLILGEGGTVANAIVTVEAASGKKLELAKSAELNQKGCTYVPHVQAVPVGSPLAIVNSDPVLHNVHSYKDDTTVFNAAEPLKDQSKTITLKTAGLLKVKCDVHGWMNAWIYVADNPYFAVTKNDGAFEIDGLPAGTYKVNIWHERLAPTSLDVVVPAGGAAKAEVRLSQK